MAYGRGWLFLSTSAPANRDHDGRKVAWIEKGGTAMSTTQRRDRRICRHARFHLESLDGRLVLSAGAGGAAAEAAVHPQVAHHTRHAAHHAHHAAHHARHSNLGAGGGVSPAQGPSGPLPANVAAALQSLYQEYESQGGGDHFTPGLPSDRLLQISGTSVAVSLKLGAGSDFNTALAQLQSDGLRVSASSPIYGLIEGLLPIAELPAAAQVAASVASASPSVLI
jgi:hypothetical protein